MGPKCHAVQCIVNGKKTPKMAFYPDATGGGLSHGDRQQAQKTDYSSLLQMLLFTETEIFRILFDGDDVSTSTEIHSLALTFSTMIRCS